MNGDFELSQPENVPGWQIVPSATIESLLDEVGTEALRVEQFGSTSPYYFAVLNNPSGLLGDPDASPQTASLVIDLEALDLCGHTFDIGVAYGNINPLVSVQGCELHIQFILLAEQGEVSEGDRKKLRGNGPLLACLPRCRLPSRAPSSDRLGVFGQSLPLVAWV